jgi:hypothetical protein
MNLIESERNLPKTLIKWRIDCETRTVVASDLPETRTMLWSLLLLSSIVVINGQVDDAIIWKEKIIKGEDHSFNLHSAW